MTIDDLRRHSLWTKILCIKPLKTVLYVAPRLCNLREIKFISVGLQK